MYSHPNNDFSEYGDNSDYSNYDSSYEPVHGSPDYAHPNYYNQDALSQAPVSPTQQEVNAPEPYTGYYEYPNATNNPYNPYNPYTPSPYQEYRNPASMPGYTSDIESDQREAAERGSADEQKAEGARKKKGLAGLGGLATTIIALLLKFKGLIFLIKFAPAILSAVISVAIYSIFLGWPFAVGLVIILFLHEMGHALVMKIKGIPVGGLIFIPMLGAAVTMRQMPQNARDEAEVGIAGPIAGALVASACLAIAEWLQRAPLTMLVGQPTWMYTIWMPLAYFGFFINLINLVPVMPFDGGRVLGAIDRRIWYLGFAALLGYQIWLWLQGNFSIWLLFFVIIAATQLWARGGAAKTEQEKRYYDVPVGTRITLGLIYFGLAAVLVFGMTISHSLMTGLIQ